VQVSNLEDITMLAVGWYSDLALESDGTVWAWGRNQAGPLGDETNTDSAIPVQVKFSQNDVSDAGIHD
jgi:alpha-tubulin suppressor-like RCC1 family protein